MDIKLTNKFKEYVKDKDINVVGIKYGKSCSSWAGTFRVPEVLKEEPSDLENFKSYNIDGIKVYVHNSIKTTDGEIKFKVTGFWKFKEIEVKGLDFTL